MVDMKAISRQPTGIGDRGKMLLWWQSVRRSHMAEDRTKGQAIAFRRGYV